MTTKNLFVRLYLSAMMVMLASTTASAQVTIGSANPPSDFSLLDLKENQDGTSSKALHLPRLNENEREDLIPSGTPNTDARGLLIFNTGTGCLEFWNSKEWISLCESKLPDPCAGLSEADFTFCDDSNPTVDDLNIRVIYAGGKGEIQWYADAIGGSPLSGNTSLKGGTNYWAEGCADSPQRVPVMVAFTFCGELPPEDANARITTFINAMYDFQRQTLIAYHTGSTVINNYQWLVSTDNVNFTILPGNSSTFVIPPYFIDNYVTNEKSKELYFRCILTTSTGDISTVALNILFIRTNTSGFGTDENNVRYLTMNRARHLGTGANTIKVALLNLGASEKTDSVFGDFYQWGRVADGHQRTVWSKDPSSRVNQITLMVGGATTSSNVPYGAASQSYNTNGQVTNSPYYGSFILRGTTHGDWGRGTSGIGSPGNYDLWGNGNGHNFRSNSPVNLSDWTVRARANNPCPAGWRIPSRFDIGDMHEADGNIDDGSQHSGSNTSGIKDRNIWTFRGMQAGTHTYGAMIITNDLTGESLILPAAGHRDMMDGRLLSLSMGTYWTSTTGNDLAGDRSWCIRFSNNSLFAGSGSGIVNNNLSLGYNVRCVKE